MKDGFVKVAALTPKIRVADCAYNTERICERIAKRNAAVPIRQRNGQRKNIRI